MLNRMRETIPKLRSDNIKNSTKNLTIVSEVLKNNLFLVKKKSTAIQLWSQTTHARSSYTVHSDRGILTSDCLRYLPDPQLAAAVLAQLVERLTAGQEVNGTILKVLK